MKLFVTYERERKSIRIEVEKMPVPAVEVIVTTGEGQAFLDLHEGESLHLNSTRRKKGDMK